MDPVWSDAGGGYPPANPPTADSVLGMFLAEVQDPNLDWPGPTATDSQTIVKRWVTQGVEEFHKAVFENAILSGGGKGGLQRDHAYLRHYLVELGLVAYADLAIDAANNLLVTSAARPFLPGDVGAYLNVTSGAGFTVQLVTIVAVNGTTATCSAAMGVVGSTGGVATMTRRLEPGVQAGCGVADFTLPSDCNLMLDALLYPGRAAEVLATEIAPTQDYRARNFPRQYGPALGRPLFSVLSSGRGRVYVSGAVLSGTEHGLRYIRTPRGVYDDNGTARVDCPSAYLRGPLHLAIGRWLSSREIDPTPSLQEFQAAVAATFPPPVQGAE